MLTTHHEVALVPADTIKFYLRKKVRKFERFAIAWRLLFLD
jgi:hypothetical protein